MNVLGHDGIDSAGAQGLGAWWDVEHLSDGGPLLFLVNVEYLVHLAVQVTVVVNLHVDLPAHEGIIAPKLLLQFAVLVVDCFQDSHDLIAVRNVRSPYQMDQFSNGNLEKLDVGRESFQRVRTAIDACPLPVVLHERLAQVHPRVTDTITDGRTRTG